MTALLALWATYLFFFKPQLFWAIVLIFIVIIVIVYPIIDANFFLYIRLDKKIELDPKTNPNAKKLDKVTYDEIIKKDLKVMDTSACALCKQNNIPINVFDFKAQGSLVKIMNGEDVGTYVSVN